MTAASVLNVREAIQEVLLWQTENLPLGDPFFHLLAATSDGDATSLDQPINPRKVVMSHHLDSPLARADVRLDIADLYVFAGQSGTVFVMNVCTSLTRR